MSQDGTKFEAKDRQGRIVRLREIVYGDHLPDRPEMAGYLHEARQTVEDPDMELVDDENNGYVYCRFGLGRDKFAKCFVKVYVYFREGIGDVATYYLSRRVGSERVVWTKTH